MKLRIEQKVKEIADGFTEYLNVDLKQHVIINPDFSASAEKIIKRFEELRVLNRNERALILSS